MSIRRELAAGITALLLTASVSAAQQPFDCAQAAPSEVEGQAAPPPPQPPPPAQVRIVAPATEVEVGQTLTFKVEAFDAAGVRR